MIYAIDFGSGTMASCQTVGLLLAGGANVNAQDGAGNTTLMGTCFKS